ncbi:MAG: septum formation inhibitor Maf, partial [Halieaceae bacterium]|nr:septum formation inhibitor Maf [Halieaceae bacterium]
MKIILASTSVYRRKLLERLDISFECLSPGIEESRVTGEAPEEMAARLALGKA